MELVGRKGVNVLVIDDDREMRSLLGQALRDAGYTVAELADPLGLLDRRRLTAVESGHLVNSEVIITDVHKRGVAGLELIDRIREIHRYAAVILISAFADENMRRDAVARGADSVLAKPFALDELLSAVLAASS